MYTQLIQQFKDAQAAAALAYQVVAVAERETFAGCMAEYCAMEARSEYKAERELASFCLRLQSRLVMEASRKFAPAGGRIEIDSAGEADRYGPQRFGSIAQGPPSRHGWILEAPRTGVRRRGR
ncbi:hypothetical protein [Caballeronia sp. LZ043]|uniref:hypothetical protein n=1 Tax=Caballeronia sp. LZ043 TaxID=3038569 RepID=UPI0028557BBF|nr:hypothetical protein [Caballeronia sp. LZ043]MDR5826029.1 hypothetical protein [Caballeronia sp. LZ043]